MKQHVIILFSLLCFFKVEAQGERLSGFDYVVIPERFDFQSERDQYQVNSLLKFLFNKYGFHAYFKDELPDVSRCDGLYAEIDRVNGFIWTEVSIKLLDCDGILFYQTKNGRSKLKNYAKAYSESIRMAFESIEILGVKQGTLQTLEKKSDQTRVARNAISDSLNQTESGSVRDKPLTNKNTPKFNSDQNNAKFPAAPLGLIPDLPLMSFKSDEVSYLLRRTSLGYQWYREDGQDLIYEGKFFVVENALFFEDKKQLRYLAKFSEQGALILERDGLELLFNNTD